MTFRSLLDFGKMGVEARMERFPRKDDDEAVNESEHHE
jgi:hypothetical protein